LQIFIRYLAVIPHKQLLFHIKDLGANFENSDLILVDREASGDGWSMITGPMNFLLGKQAVYFFNPDDLNKIDTEKYTNVYFIIPDSQSTFYEKNGLSEKMTAVESYEIINNFLESDVVEKNVAYLAPVVLPNEQVISVLGKIYKLNK
jgi:hypothetical protein